MIQILAPARPVAPAQTRTPEGWRGWRYPPGSGDKPSNEACAGHAAVPVSRPIRLPGPARPGPETRRRRAGAAQPPRGNRRRLGLPRRHERAGPQAEADRRHPRHPADAPGAAPVRRLGRQLHPGAARRGHGDGPAHRDPRHRPARRPAGTASTPRPPKSASPKPARRSSTPWQTANRAPAADLARIAGTSAGVVRGMADAGLLLPALLPTAPPFASPDPDHPGEPVPRPG